MKENSACSPVSVTHNGVVRKKYYMLLEWLASDLGRDSPIPHPRGDLLLLFLNRMRGFDWIKGGEKGTQLAQVNHFFFREINF